MSNIGHNMKALRESENMTQGDLASKIGVSRSTIGMYERGLREPDFETTEAIADLFNVDMNYLLGKGGSENSDFFSARQRNRIPVLGSIPAGIAIEAIEDVTDWEELPDRMMKGGKQYFGLKVKGDSMWPDFLEGDTVIIQRQPVCENGDICAVYINGFEATLKQVRLHDDGSITLQPKNPNYPPRTFTAEEVKTTPVTIAGVVVELRRNFMH